MSRIRLVALYSYWRKHAFAGLTAAPAAVLLLVLSLAFTPLVCEAQSYTLTVATGGDASGTVVSDLAGIHCGSECSAAYPYGTAVTLAAEPAPGSCFTGWSGDCYGCSCIAYMYQDISVQADFGCATLVDPAAAEHPYNLAWGGFALTLPCATTWVAVSSNPEWLTLNMSPEGTGSAYISYVAAANLGESPRTGTITVAGMTFTVTQAGEPRHTLTVSNSDGSLGTVADVSGGISCGADCTETYGDSLRARVTLNATAYPGAVFLGWSGACTGSGPCTLTMDGDKAVSAAFSCTEAIDPGAAAFGVDGGTGRLSVFGSPQCRWTPEVDAPSWISTWTTSQYGDGTVEYSVLPNDGTDARTGRITVSGRSLVVRQEGSNPLEQWRWRGSVQLGNEYHGLAYGNGTFVAVGCMGSTAYSTDGLAWKRSYIGSYDRIYYDATFVNGTFFAVGGPFFFSPAAPTPEGYLLTSSDGISWTQRYTGTGLDLRGVAYGNGTYVAVGGSSAYPYDQGLVLTSPDARQWTAAPSAGTSPFSAVAFGNGVFVAAGTEGIATSTDGANWTTTSGSAVSYDFFTSGKVLFGNGRFAMLTAGGVAVSSDGYEWTQSYRYGNTIAYGNGVFVVLDAGNVYTSADGLDWTLVPSNLASAGSSYIGRLSYGNGLFVALSGMSSFVTSADLATWTVVGAGLPPVGPVPPPGTPEAGGARLTPVIDKLAHGRNAMGQDRYAAIAGSAVLASADLDSWSPTNIGSGLSGLTYGNGHFVGVSGNVFSTSWDGAYWSSSSPGVLGTMRDVLYAGGAFVAVGDAGLIVTSTDGYSWTPAVSGTGENLFEVQFDNKVFVVLGGVPNTYGYSPSMIVTTILTSADRGVTWTALPQTQAFRQVAWGNGVFLAIGAGSAAPPMISGYGLFRSTDGVQWAEETPDYSLFPVGYYTGRTMKFGGGYFLIYPGAWYSFGYSADGLAWKPAAIPGPCSYSVNVLFADDRFVVAGGNFSPEGGFLIQSGTIGRSDIADAVDNKSVSWTTGGDAPWFRETTDFYPYGYPGPNDDAAQSGPIGVSQRSWVQTRLTGPATVYFAWKASSESPNRLTFSLDGAPISNIGGPENYWYVQWGGSRVPAGTHTLKWEYAKNTPMVSGVDAVWLDQVQISRTLTIGKDGDGSGSVEPSFCAAYPCSVEVPQGRTFSLTARPDPGSEFAGWSGDCNLTGECLLVVDGPRTVTAVFRSLCHYVITPGGASLGAGSGSGSFEIAVEPGCSWTLRTESPWVGFDPASGTGGGTVAFSVEANRSPDERTGTIALGEQSFTIVQAGEPFALLSVTTSGGGAGTVASQPAGIDCGADCDESFPSGVAVELTATHAAGSWFSGWSGACAGRGACLLTMDAAWEVGAGFELCAYGVEPQTALFGHDGGGGSFSVDATGDCPWSPATDAGWIRIVSGGGDGGGAVEYTVDPNPGAAPRQGVVAVAGRVFTVDQEGTPVWRLTVSRAGSGAGDLVGDPAGIDCGGECAADYPDGTTVALTAAAGPGFTFAGWSGACGGTGGCAVEMNGDRAVTAVFVALPPDFQGHDWDVQPVADTTGPTHAAQVIDRWGRPHLAFVSGGGPGGAPLAYATYDGRGWTVETLGLLGAEAPAHAPAIVATPAGPMVFCGGRFFFRDGDPVAGAAGWASSAFTTQAVAQVSAAYEESADGSWRVHLAYIAAGGLFYTSLTEEGPGAEEAVDPDAGSGSVPGPVTASIAVAGGVAHVGYALPGEPLPSQIRHASRASGLWVVETVAAAAECAEAGLRADAGGLLHLLFADRWATGDGSAWVVRQLPGSFAVPAFYPDADGNLAVAATQSIRHVSAEWPAYSTEEVFYEPAPGETVHTCAGSLVGPVPHVVFVAQAPAEGSAAGQVKYAFPFPLTELALLSVPEVGARFEVDGSLYASPAALRWERFSLRSVGVVAPAGCAFIGWTDERGTFLGAENPIVVTLDKARTIVARFNRPPTIGAIGDLPATEGGTLNFVLDVADPDGDPVACRAENLPAGAVFDAAACAFSWRPGYDQAGVYPGVRFLASDGQFTVEASVTIAVANFTFAIRAAAGAGGSISPAGTLHVDPGATATFAIVPAAHYHVTDVLVDGVSVGAVAAYTFAGIASDHTIAASFLADDALLVTAPNGGEFIGTGTTFPVAWACQPQIATVNIYYRIGQGAWQVVASGVSAASGGYPWVAPATLLRNYTNVRLLIRGYGVGGIKLIEDQSDAAFTLGAVRVTAPAGGEVFAGGRIVPVTWEQFAVARPTAWVRVKLNASGGNSWKLVAQLPGDALGYSWTVPVLKKDRESCAIRVELVDADGGIVGWDSSPGDFTIQAP